jgi:hypothetical protein
LNVSSLWGMRTAKKKKKVFREYQMRDEWICRRKVFDINEKIETDVNGGCLHGETKKENRRKRGRKSGN